ncbi:MAG: hypothetical protein QM754_16445 [Tepidisphaeraceae bacterium]
MRKSVLVLAVASVGVGCDDSSATDKATVEQVRAAVSQMNTLPSLAPGQGVGTVTTALSTAAGGAQSGTVKAVAAGTAAAVDQQAAYASVIELKKRETDVRRTLGELQRLTAAVQAGQDYAAGYLKADPKATVTDVASKITSIQGNAQAATWGPDEKPTLPTLAAASAEVSKLDSELAQKQQQLAAAEKEKTDLLAKAEVQQKASDSLKGEEAIKAFNEASETRRQGEDKNVDIDLLNVQIGRLSADLALAKGQVTVLGSGIDALKEQAKQVESGWVTTQKSAQTQQQLIAAAVQGDDKTPQSIKAVAETLAKQLSELSTARQDTIGQLNEAEKFAKLAQTEAGTFATSIATKVSLPGKEGEHYKSLKNAVHQQAYQYRVGAIQTDRGTLALGQAALYAEIKRTIEAARSAIESAKITVPESLAGIDAAIYDELIKAAETDLTDGAQSLTNVESGDSPKEYQAAAKATRLINLFAQLRLFDRLQAAGDTAAKDKAVTTLSDAKALRDEIIANNQPLPNLPGELGTVPAAPATPTAVPAPTESTPAGANPGSVPPPPGA